VEKYQDDDNYWCGCGHSTRHNNRLGYLIRVNPTQEVVISEEDDAALDFIYGDFKAIGIVKQIYLKVTYNRFFIIIFIITIIVICTKSM